MKTVLRLGCIALVMASIPSFFGFSKESTTVASMEGRPIIIRQDPHPQGAPRSPEIIPFIAELSDGLNSVLLGATFPCGTVSVQIVSTAGDDYATYFDTSDGAILLPVSGNAGDYTLTITVPGGAVYVGEFSI